MRPCTHPTCGGGDWLAAKCEPNEAVVDVRRPGGAGVGPGPVCLDCLPDVVDAFVSKGLALLLMPLVQSEVA